MKECSGDSGSGNSMCPPRMSDGRMFTDYRPRCIANFSIPGLNEIEGNYDLPNSYEYRQYLVNNATDLITKNQQAAYKTNSCGPCTNPYNDGTMLPEQRLVKCDSSTCTFYQNDAGGLGLGRVYDSPSPVQSSFLTTKKQEQASLEKQQAACTSKKQYSGVDADYYSFNGASADQMGRALVPSGAAPIMKA